MILKAIDSKNVFLFVDLSLVLVVLFDAAAAADAAGVDFVC